RRNAGRAGFLAHLEVEQAELGRRPAPAGPGLLVVNPPYGRRIGGLRGRELGRLLRTGYGGWRAGVLLPVADRGGLGWPPEAMHPLTNGGLRVSLLVTELLGPRPQVSVN
ncbi:MAG TPA: hypothetical protein VN914_15615, partial [Polyangia bacterium]|nr:hypothetical protein [Polyangia bacterium]